MGSGLQMDWVEEQLVKVKNRLRMKSLRSVLGIYILLAVFLTIALYILTNLYCDSWKNIIYGKYGVDYTGLSQFMDLVKLEPIDTMWLRHLSSIQTFAIIPYSIVSMVLTTTLFYKNKIQDPITILMEEATYISRGDLGLSCNYESGDELGKVCDAFEKMRLHLTRNNENMWSLMEGQRLLNATFAHDIRSPLTVLQGYTEMLMKYYPQGKISEEKLLETLSLMESQILQLRKFSDTMKGLQDIESLEIRPKENEYGVLLKQLEENMEVIGQQHNIDIVVNDNIGGRNNTLVKGYYDMLVVVEVVNNLLSNAYSFAKSIIEITIEVEGDYLHIYVSDDGNGFSKQELYTACNPYYSSRKQTNGHWGIGLTICKLLCEKHGGKITISNSIRQGAIVCASFRVI